MIVKRGNKGRRYIIVHAGGKEGWIGVPYIFEATSKSGDYHDNMNSSNFENYFKELCKYCKEVLKKDNVIFCMDNAKYHRREDGHIIGSDRTLSQMNKAELIKRLYNNGVKETTVNLSKMLKPALYEMAKLSEYTPPLASEVIAKSYGYKIFWLPPYHPELNPIEEAWGLTKQYVARENDGGSFQVVKELILKGFAKVTPMIWKKLIQRTEHNEKIMLKQYHILLHQEIQEYIIDISDTEEEIDESNKDYQDKDEEFFTLIEDDIII